MSGRADDEDPAVVAKKSFFDKPFSVRNAIMLRAVPRFCESLTTTRRL